MTRRQIALSLAVLLAIVGLVVASPRHRAFYRSLLGTPPPPAPAVTAPGPPRQALPAVPTPARSAPQPQAPPPVPPEPRPGAPLPEPKQKVQPPPAPVVVKVPRGGPGEQVVVKIVEEIPGRLPFVGVPVSWEIKEFTGRAQVEVVRDGDRIVFRLASEDSSYALYRDVVLDAKEFPLLAWSWKVTRLPTGGDVRERTADDQAGQVYVIFPRWPFPRINSDVVGYVWDSRAPVGLRLTSSQSSNVKLIVLQSGIERVGQWVREERNIYQDYVELFGKEPRRVGQVAIMIDSNDTRSQAEALVDELVFRRGPSRTSSANAPGER